MILKQYCLGCLSHFSYLIGDQASGTAAVVDPQRDVEQYLVDARQLGLTIRHVLLTHFHADFISGHLELRERTGAAIHMGASARADFPIAALADGAALAWGDVRIVALATPGHTPESTSYVVYDLARSGAAPHAVLTGDTLFLGDVGRPDLLASIGVAAQDLAGMLYDSVHAKLLALPDATLVYPAHGAGSMCGKSLSKDSVSTIGTQRQTNYALQPMPRQQFIALVTKDQPEAPRYFAHDATLNRRTRPTLDRHLRDVLKPLALEDVLRLANAGAQVIDSRDPAEFEAAHLIGSLNFGLGGKFETWLGTLLDPSLPAVIVAAPGREHETAVRMGRIGFDQISGFLSGGVGALAPRRDLVGRTARIEAPALARELARAEPPIVLDVRAASEWQERHIARSLNIPLHQLPQRLHEVPRDQHLVVHCQSGYRSAIATSLLKQRGILEVEDVVGGIQAWEAAQLAVVNGAAAHPR
ncbi:MAG: MBL fold metallo-hydrolase [Planctomycetota bacterium]